MTAEDSLRENGYVVIHGNLQDWTTSSFTAARCASLIFCASGKATIEINMIEHEISAFSYIGVAQDSLVKINDTSDDFTVIELRYLYETGLSATVGLSTETIQNLFRHSNKKITDPGEIAIITNLLNTLELYSAMLHSAHHSDFTHGLLRCLYIALADICSRDSSDIAPAASYTTADSYFMSFVTLLNKHYRQQHDVAFYADKLNITPKYLNEIARKKVNHTAKDIITRFIVAQLKRELLISGNSVQRIAYDFNFCDQSSLGKFFKKATGMSPVAFRHSPQ